MNLDIGIAGWIVSGEVLREKTLTLLEFPELCASYGVKTVELCSRFFENQDAKYLNELRQRLQDNGLSVRNIAVDMGNIAGADEKVRRTDLEGLKQWFYTAAAVNSEAIRINTGHADDDSAVDRVIAGYGELVAVGEQAGVRLLIENHGGISATAEGVTQILDGVKSDWFGTCPDSANFAPEHWQTGMQSLMPRAFSCHVKVFSLDEEGRQDWEDREGNKRGFGMIQFFELLKESGYSGPLCVEKSVTENAREGIADTLDYVRAMMEKAA